jgi:hypothetical protein
MEIMGKDASNSKYTSIIMPFAIKDGQFADTVIL